MLDVPVALSPSRSNDARARRNNLLSASIVSIQQNAFVSMSPTNTANLRDVSSKRAYNEQQPVSQLIRAGVFHFILLYLSDTYPPGRSKNAPYVLGWIYATHICSSMRVVALDISALWARHVCAFGSQEVFKALSRRAKETPIAISNVRDYHMDRHIKAYTVPEHYLTALREAKCGSLSLNLMKQDVEKVADALYTHDLLYLRTVDLRCFELHHAVLPPDIEVHAVQLRRVTLFNMYVQVAGQNLVSIDIDGGHGHWANDGPGSPTKSQLLRMLEGCVNLQSLRLRGTACTADLTKTVHLPDLVDLVLLGTSALNVASQLVYPRLKVAVIAQSDSVDVSSLQALSLLRCDEDFWGGSAQLAPKLYVLTFGHPYDAASQEVRLLVQAARWGDAMKPTGNTPRIERERSRPPYSESALPQPQLDVTASLDGVSTAPGSHAEMLDTVVRAHAKFSPSMLHAVEILHLAAYPAQALNWRVLGEPFPSVHTLYLAHEQPRIDADDGLLAALTETTLEGGLVLPKLHTLVVDKTVPWRPRDYARFREMLAFRARRGAPVLCVRDASESGVWRPADKAMVAKYYEELVALPAVVE